MTKHMRRVFGVLEKNEFSVLYYRTNKHMVIRARHRSGACRSFTVGATPSDHRSYRNFEAIVRRTAQAA